MTDHSTKVGTYPRTAKIYFYHDASELLLQPHLTPKDEHIYRSSTIHYTIIIRKHRSAVRSFKTPGFAKEPPPRQRELSLSLHLFIEKGLSRTFYYKDVKDITDWISTEGTFACSIVSFITRQPDIRNIELLEDSVIWGIHHDDLEKLYSQHHDIERLGRLLVSAGVVQMQHRFDELHFTSASERYKQLLKIHPDIVLRVPLGMIASYLGITQETLSRMRAQLQ